MDPGGNYCLDFLRAEQLGHFLGTIPPPPATGQPLTVLEEWCTDTGVLPHALSLTHELVILPTEDHRLPCFTEWERALNRTFSEKKREKILSHTHKSSICTRVQETNYKILTGWYRTPDLLHKIFPATSDRCWRCMEDKGTMLHVFWSCPRLHHFWSEVRRITQQFSDREIPDDPAFFLLHATDAPTRVYKKSIVRHLLDSAKACIPVRWKSPLPPTIAMWLRRIDEINRMEDLILTNQDRQKAYTDAWRIWNIFSYSEEGIALRGESTPPRTLLVSSVVGPPRGP